jgi:hypothetical protein
MNALDMQRRLFLGSAVGALALRPSRTAQADTAFTNFSFAATGAPAARTMPDRLRDVINVKDWGAKGDGVNDDRPATMASGPDANGRRCQKACHRRAQCSL